MSKKVAPKKKIMEDVDVSVLDKILAYNDNQFLSYNIGIPDFGVYTRTCKTIQDYDKVFKHCQKYYLVLQKEINVLAELINDTTNQLRNIHEAMKLDSCGYNLDDPDMKECSDILTDDNSNNNDDDFLSESNSSKGTGDSNLVANLDDNDNDINNKIDNSDDDNDKVDDKKPVIKKKVIVKKTDAKKSDDKVAVQPATKKEVKKVVPKKQETVDTKKIESKDETTKKPLKKKV